MTTRTMTSFPAFVGRLSWMIFGPFALATLGHQHRRAGRRLVQPVRPDLLPRLGGMLARPLDRVPVQPAADGDAASPPRPSTCAGMPWASASSDSVVWVAANLVGNRAIRVLD